MQDFIEQQMQQFGKDFCTTVPYQNTELVCWKGIKEKNINLIPTARTVGEWIQETLKEHEAHMIQEFEKMLPEEIDKIDDYNFGFNGCRSIVVEKLNNLKK